MAKPNSKTVNVYLTLDQLVIEGYFNQNDPSPIYKRQLSHDFEEYVSECVKGAKRYDVIFYKFKCNKDIDKKYAEPLMYAIRKHYKEKQEEEERAFERFKNRNWTVLAISLVIVVLFQFFLPLIVNEENQLQLGLSHLMDVFAWVILWHPIDELLFNWNPHLKKISILNKLATAQIIIIENEKKSAVNDPLRVVA
ncbi:MAG: hypothetical protein K0S09_2462 [Sphingobacteriaceae bacterium]|jgi:hypothetical protein|nr:hypothetical protein [Sphingobacteriaceae bacterium]